MKRRALAKRLHYADGLTVIAFAMLTGAATGVIVTLYNILVNYGETVSVYAYGEIFARPYFIPLLVVALALGAILAGIAIRFVPMVRGSGIPQTEGAARGLFRLHWFSTMCTMFAVSLAAVFLGLCAGSEGPSVLMGGCTGEGIGTLSKRERADERILVSAGASAGLAVAFNAPLTGLLFSVEEASKKFTPRLLVATLCSVVTGLAVRGGLRALISLADPEILPYAPTFSAFDLTTLGTFKEIMIAAGLAIGIAAAAALAGVLFYHSIFIMRSLLGRITLFGGAGKLFVPFLLAGALGMLSPSIMTGGHSFIESVGTYGGTSDMDVSLRFGAALSVTLVVIFAARFLASACNMGAGVPCGAFVPMLAIGAGFGAILSFVLTTAGLGAEYSDLIVMLSIASFFSAVVKAPISSAVMVFELTGSYNFALLLPAVIAVTVAFIVSSALHTRPVYDSLLVSFVLPSKQIQLPAAPSETE